MPSYKLYRIKPDFNIKTYISNNWIEDAVLPKGLSENIKRKFNQIKKNIQKSSVSQDDSLKLGYKAKLNCEHKLVFGSQEIWIPKSIEIIKNEDLLLIQKLSSNINMVIERSLDINIVPISFPEKDLLGLWRKLKKSVENDGKHISLHRLIIEKTFLESDEINELNISTSDVSQLGYFKDLTSNAKKIKVITIRIKGLAESKKVFTVRIARNQMQIYGTHPTSTIIKFLEYFQK